MKEFNLGPEVVVSDPCYDIPTWCQAIVTGVLPGTYIPEVDYSDEGDWGTRVAALRATHIDFYVKPGLIEWSEHPAVIGVDSGQCGIFDKDSYRNDEQSKTYGVDRMWEEDWNEKDGDDWYQRMCTLTSSEEDYGVYPNGVVSSSGYGDGSYTLLVGKIDNQIVALEIVFIGTEPDDDEDFEDEEED